MYATTARDPYSTETAKISLTSLTLPGDPGVTLMSAAFSDGEAPLLFELELDEFQVGELIAALQRRRHIMPER